MLELNIFVPDSDLNGSVFAKLFTMATAALGGKILVTIAPPNMKHKKTARLSAFCMRP
jgi:hypothetical protein